MFPKLVKRIREMLEQDGWVSVEDPYWKGKNIEALKKGDKLLVIYEGEHLLALIDMSTKGGKEDEEDKVT